MVREIFRRQQSAILLTFPTPPDGSYDLANIPDADLKCIATGAACKPHSDKRAGKRARGRESAARAKAEQLLAEIRQAPQNFEKFAKEHSQDPGTAEKGGDLGFFSRNMMVKSFEDAVFQMKLNEISDVVETNHGFHIIRLTGIKAGKPVNLSEVKVRVEEEIKKQKARKLFDEMAEGFSNTVYEQSDSLKPAAEKFNLALHRSDWIGKKGGQPYFSNARLLQAVFSEDAIKNKHNTEAVEVAPNTLVAARVLDYRPASTPSLVELKDKISALVTRQEAASAAVRVGKDKLAQLRENKAAGVSWSPAQQVSRRDPLGLDMETLRAVFSADMSRLPAFVGLPNFEGSLPLFVSVRLSSLSSRIWLHARLLANNYSSFSPRKNLRLISQISGRDMTYL